MERENRYLVLKIDDVINYLTADERQMLGELTGKIGEKRTAEDKPIKDYVVVAEDWPMYEAVWKMIEHYVDAQQNPIQQPSPRTPVSSYEKYLLDRLERYANDIFYNFQDRVHPWMKECFGDVISEDTIERNHRFLEEALELVQACECTADEAHQLVDYVYGRDVGEKGQEVGGVMVTLAALCLAQKIDMHEEAETELRRIWGKIEQIRAKQASKPNHSPLPE